MRFLIAVFLASASLTQAWSGEFGWTRYTNDRFGASAEIPVRLFLAERAPEDGDGQSFRSGDNNAVIRLYGSLYSATADNFVAFAKASIEEVASDGLDITYKTMGPGFFVYSGFKRGVIVYNKTIFGCKDVAETIEIEYPAASKAMYDPLVTHLAGSLEARAGIECP